MPYCSSCNNASQFIYECKTYELVTFDAQGRLSTQHVLASKTLKVRCYRCNSEEVDTSATPEGKVTDT